MSTLRSTPRNRALHSILTALLLVMMSSVFVSGCGNSNSSSTPDGGSEAALEARVAGYWDLRIEGDSIRRYQDFMASEFKAETSLEDYVRNVTGVAVYKAYEIKRVQIDESGKAAKVLVEYQWHISPGIAPVKMKAKTAPWESDWVLEEDGWRLLRIVPDEEQTMLD